MKDLTVERFSLSIFPYAKDLAVRLNALKAQVSQAHTEVTPSDLHDISHDRHTQYLFLQYHGVREAQHVVGMLLIVRSPLLQSALLGPIVVDRLGPVRGHGTQLMGRSLEQVWMLLIVRSPLLQSALLGPIVVDRLGPVRGHGTQLMGRSLEQVWMENPALQRIDLTTAPARGLVPWYEQFGFVVRDTTPMRLERPSSAACP